MNHLDKQMQIWSTELRTNLNLTEAETNHLATTIAHEVVTLPEESKQRVRDASPVPLKSRIEELLGFQGFMDEVRIKGGTAPVNRAQVVYQNYICFVYLSESCFSVLKKELRPESATRKCCRFLTDNPVRAFRNAVAHSNWQYNSDFSGLEFWARKGAEPTDPIIRFEVLQQELAFWQSLARCTGYAAFLHL